MLEKAWKINDSFTHIALATCELAERLSDKGPEVAIALLPQIDEAHGVIRHMRATLHKLEGMKHALLQGYSYAAYLTDPQVVFAPLPQWHKKLDIAEDLIEAIRAKFGHYVV